MAFALSAFVVTLCFFLFVSFVLESVIIFLLLLLLSLSLFVAFLFESIITFPLFLSLSSSLLLFEKWFSPRGEIFRSGVSFCSVVVFEKHVRGHRLGDQGHDGVFLEFL